MTTRGTDEPAWDRRMPAELEATAVIGLPGAPATTELSGSGPLPWVGTAAAPARFAQLTYTSFHRPDGSGGWQVKDVRGELSDAERRALTERITTTVDGSARGQRFLTPDEVDALPRRLVHGPVGGSAVAYWHTVSAGMDSSGRPGNVFAHVLLDRAPQHGDPVRPGDLLHSPMWLRPFGADEVLATTLDATPDPPWPGGPFDRQRVLEFLVQKAVWRSGTLVGLLDAVSAAMEDGRAGGQRGPLVVLGLEAPEQAELWIAGICHLMSPRTSQGLYFSTSERPGGLAAAWSSGLHLVVLPRADLDALEPDDDRLVLISDEDGAVDFNDVESGGEHTTVLGSRIPVTPWSSIAQVVLGDAAVAEQALRLQDEIAAEAGDTKLACSWPLAMAVVTRQDLLGDALIAARLALGGPMPPGLPAGSRLHRARKMALQQGLGVSTADALAAASAGAGDRAFATGVYLERAMDDRAWLLRPEGVPVPEVAPEDLEVDVVEQAQRALAALAGGAGRVDATSAAAALRLLDLSVRAGLLDVRYGPARSDTATVTALMDRLVAPLLLDPVAGPALVDRVGPLAESTQAAFLRPWFDAHLEAVGGRPGGQLSPLLLQWLFPQPPAAPGADRLARPGSIPATLREAAAQANLVLADPTAWRSTAVAAALGAPGAEAGRLALGPQLPIDELRGLLAAFGPAPLLPVLRPTLLASRFGEALDAIVDEVRAARPTLDPTHPAVAAVLPLAELRWLEGIWWRSGSSVERAVQLVGLMEDLLAAEAPPLSVDLKLSTIAAHFVDLLGRPAPPVERPGMQWLVRSVEKDGVLPANLAYYLGEAVQQGILTDFALVCAAQASSPAAGAVPFGPPWLVEVNRQVSAKDHAPREPLLDRVVRHRIAKGLMPTAYKLVVAVRAKVEASVTGAGRFPDPRRTMQDYDGFAWQWWRSVGVIDDAALGPVATRRRR